MNKEKFYVVWSGVNPGIYTSWTDCQLQTKGYEGAKYKSFETREEAEKAFESSPYEYIKRSSPGLPLQAASTARLFSTTDEGRGAFTSFFWAGAPGEDRLIYSYGEDSKAFSASSRVSNDPLRVLPPKRKM